MKTVRNLAVNLALLLVTVLICLVSAEMILRLWYFNSLELRPPNFRMHEPHPTLGWTLKPNSVFFRQTVDYQLQVKSNSLGYNDVEHDVTPKKGVKRILLLGDSFTEAGQVPFDNSMGRILQKQLAGQKIEIINMGIWAYGTAQQYLTLAERGGSYKPDLVVLFFCFNDLMDNSKELIGSMITGKPVMSIFGRPYFTVDPANGELLLKKPEYERSLAWASRKRQVRLKRYKKKSYIERLLIYSSTQKLIQSYRVSKRAAKRKHDPNIKYGAFLNEFQSELGIGKITSSAEYERRWHAAWQVTCRLLERIKQRCNQQGSEFLLVTVPTKLQVEPDVISRIKGRYPGLKLDFDLVNRRLRACADAKGIAFLDILPQFRADWRENREWLFHQINDAHWNRRGHQIAASAVLEHLSQHRITKNLP